MKTFALVASLASAALVAACVVIPTAPMVTALPGSQKSIDQFQLDDESCRGSAQAVVRGPGEAATNTAAANAAIGTAIGAAAGAIIGSATGAAGEGAAIGAGTGLLFGGAAGSNYAGASSYELQRQYDIAYVQCMYARGHRVPAAFVSDTTVRPSSVPAYPPRDYPPPAAPAPRG